MGTRNADFEAPWRFEADVHDRRTDVAHCIREVNGPRAAEGQPGKTAKASRKHEKPVPPGWMNGRKKREKGDERKEAGKPE